MGPRTKLLIGTLLIILGVWWYAPGTVINSFLEPFSTVSNFRSLLVLIQGSIGVFAVLIGIFVVWIELDEIRMRKELESQEFGEKVSQSVQTVAEAGATSGSDEEDETAEEEGGHTCDECGRSFDSERGLHVHQSQVH